MNWAKILKNENPTEREHMEDTDLGRYRKHHEQLEKLAEEIRDGYGSLGYQGDEISEILYKAVVIMDEVIESYSNEENWNEKGHWIGD